MRSIHVNLKERSYPIFIGRDLLKNTGHILKERGVAGRAALVVSQKPIAVYYQNILSDSLSREGFECDFFLPPFSKSSEAAKSQSVFWKLIKKIASLDGKKRSVFLIALGGGVVGDLAGFAACVYKRGVPYIQIPTTLTAQVDSAIGGKTGIDLPEGKNLLGAVYQPRLVLSDVELLSSLPERHWSDGFAEVIKYGVIKDGSLFSLLERKGKEGIRRDKSLLEKIIFLSARIKAKIIEKDEFDKKEIRMILNFGHTVAHALEAASRFSREMTHGEAVGVGMLAAFDIARGLGVLKDPALAERLEKTLMKFDLPLFYRGLSLEAIRKALGYDKKAEGGVNRYVLPVSLGNVIVVRDVPESLVNEALQKRKG